MGGIEFQSPSMPVISNVTAAPHGDPDSIREVLGRQVTSPVLWERSMRFLIAQGASEFLEPGPGSVLSGILGKIDRDKDRCNVARMEELEELANGQAGA